MSIRTELNALGFELVGAIKPHSDGKGCKAEMSRNVDGFVVYAHVVGDEIKKFGTTKAPLRSRVGQNASTITQLIALAEGRAKSDAAWHHRPFDAFKRLAPEVIRSNQTIEVWAKVSTEAEYRVLERELNGRYQTSLTGWAILLG